MHTTHLAGPLPAGKRSRMPKVARAGAGGDLTPVLCMVRDFFRSDLECRPGFQRHFCPENELVGRS